MSFILDALRKSELERQRQNGPSIAELPIARDDRRLPWALLAIGLLLAVNVGVLLFFLLRDATGSITATGTTSTAAPGVAASLPAAPMSLPAAPMSLPANAAPRGNAPDDALQAPVSELLAEASAPPPAPDPTLLPDAPVTYAPELVDEYPPSIRDLPAQSTAGLPELSVDLHIYSDDPARRAIFINGRRYQTGGVLAEGPTVEEINREGAVLSYHGQRFLLPRQ
jgi:general secretion pathway protein B